jgi:ferric-chelate reductase
MVGNFRSVLAFAAFFITICYHTIFASPWIFPPLAFYGADMMLRLFRYRIKDAILTPIDKQMTIVSLIILSCHWGLSSPLRFAPYQIRVANCDDGWVAGQHVQLRVFFANRLFESHPLTILTAPPSISCLQSPDLILGARVNGDWSRALNLYAKKSMGQSTDEPTIAEHGAQVQVMIDGPYGGCSIDPGNFESVLFVAGGSGATFTLGLLDDIVGRCIKLGRRGGERTRRIEFAWCVRSFGKIFYRIIRLSYTYVSVRSDSIH